MRSFVFLVQCIDRVGRRKLTTFVEAIILVTACICNKCQLLAQLQTDFDVRSVPAATEDEISALPVVIITQVELGTSPVSHAHTHTCIYINQRKEKSVQYNHWRQRRRGHIPSNILVGGTSVIISPPILLRTFGYSRPIFVVLAQ